MNKITYKVGAALGTVALLASVFTPATFAATNNVLVTGTGPFSWTGVGITNKHKTYVNQSNYTHSKVNANINHNTGNNTSMFNSGAGNTTTGAANSNVNTVVGGSSNSATLPSCGCDSSANNVLVTDTGAFSGVGVGITNKNKTTVYQENTTVSKVNVNSNQNTGNNTSMFNDGGSATITTGDANSNVNTTVGGSVNTVN